MNMIQWGMSWHNYLRNKSTTSLATIVHSGGELTVSATKIEPGSFTNVEGRRVTLQHSIMMFNSKDVERVRFNRVVNITKGGIDYEVIIDKLTKQEFDDPENLTTNVPVKQCS
jgi:hypothetical protein